AGAFGGEKEKEREADEADQREADDVLPDLALRDAEQGNAGEDQVVGLVRVGPRRLEGEPGLAGQRGRPPDGKDGDSLQAEVENVEDDGDDQGERELGAQLRSEPAEEP